MIFKTSHAIDFDLEKSIITFEFSGIKSKVSIILFYKKKKLLGPIQYDGPTPVSFFTISIKWCEFL
jgi:hypothetical protein